MSRNNFVLEIGLFILDLKQISNSISQVTNHKIIIKLHRNKGRIFDRKQEKRSINDILRNLKST